MPLNSTRSIPIISMGQDACTCLSGTRGFFFSMNLAFVAVEELITDVILHVWPIDRMASMLKSCSNTSMAIVESSECFSAKS